MSRARLNTRPSSGIDRFTSDTNFSSLSSNPASSSERASRGAALSLLYLYYDKQTTAATAPPWQRLAGDLYSSGGDTGDGNSEVALALRDCVVLVE